ncbi:restriction endonuclease subunit S [Bacillus thuringiensis]|uniref:Restriction endonuclease subunit S n=1 Tax=Bacillus thuringiensis serovar kumamotoensis TaxID=132267 RepID=A0A9X6JP63_BACUK|nr:restriction endonuclease subunit S [Bacillus thuringiensis]OTZ72412.1 restriction endonuclease subunit S [Bacillus thuringiensis serovar kumamtoensis]
MKNKRTPDIRFPGFPGDWEQCNLGNISTKIGSGKTPKGGNQNYKSEGIPLLRSQNIFNNKVNFNDVAYITPEIDEDMANSRVQKGDVLLNITGASIGRSAVYKLNHKANVNQHVSIIRPSSEVNPYFIQLNIASEKGQKQIELNQAGGGREGLNFQQIAKMAFYFPNLVEQGKIGDFFIQLDNIIALLQQELTTLKQTKQGFLQKMFPKEGESVPEVRFPGFTGEWEQRRLGEMLKERNEQIPENEEYPLMSFVQGTGVTPKGDRYDRSFLVKDDNKKYKKTELGDFIYSSNNLETGSIGFNKTGKAVISPVYSIFSSKTKLESQFIGILSTRKDFIWKMVRFRQGVVYGQWRIHEKDFLDIQISVPSHNEQEEIIGFFANLDNLITLHQRELEVLKETKKAFLQKMFV